MATDRAEKGEKPSGLAAQHTTLTATVEGIDKKTSQVTLRGPAGNLRTITARDPKKLANVKVGDRVVITYTETLAVAVRPVTPAAEPAAAP